MAKALVALACLCCLVLILGPWPGLLARAGSSGFAVPALLPTLPRLIPMLQAAAMAAACGLPLAALAALGMWQLPRPLRLAIVLACVALIVTPAGLLAIGVSEGAGWLALRAPAAHAGALALPLCRLAQVTALLLLFLLGRMRGVNPAMLRGAAACGATTTRAAMLIVPSLSLLAALVLAFAAGLLFGVGAPIMPPVTQAALAGLALLAAAGGLYPGPNSGAGHA